MRFHPSGRRIAPSLATLILVSCGPRGPSIPAIPSSSSGKPTVSAPIDKTAVQTKGKNPPSRQKRRTQPPPLP